MKTHILFLLSILIFAACTEKPSSPKATPPNIVLVITDDQGWGDLSMHGNDSIYTPVIDQLAKESVTFDRFYVSPVCAPTRASLLTGRYHLRTGVTWVTHRKEVMRAEEVTLAEALKENGYATGIFGKWHNGEQYPNHPNGQGFDEFYGFCSGHWNNYFNTTLDHNGKPVQSEGYIIDDLTDKAIDFIKQNKEQPFFCYLPYNTPHSPMQVADSYFDKYKSMGLTDFNAAAYGMVENIDDNLKRVLATLDETGLKDNTIFLFTTDNGPNGVRFNGGMKGKKGSVDEGGVRVPLIIRYPNGNFQVGKSIKELAMHIDLMPTLLDMAGLPIPANIQFDGTSLLSLFKEGNPDWQERQLYTFHTAQNHKPNPGALRTNQYRWVLEKDSTMSLFDMLKDPGQKENIVDQHPDLVASFDKSYHDAYADVTSNGNIPPPIHIGHEAHPLVHFPAPEAQLSGGVVFKEFWGWANDWATTWTNSEGKDGMTWDTKVVSPGMYQIRIEYAAPEEAVGSTFNLQIGEANKGFSIEEAHVVDYLPSPDRVPRWEVYEKEWKEIVLGEFELEKQDLDIKIQAKDLKNGENLEIKGLWIEKVK